MFYSLPDDLAYEPLLLLSLLLLLELVFSPLI